MAPNGSGAPSGHETQPPSKSLVETNPTSSAAELNKMVNSSIEEDTPDADERLGSGENIGVSNLNMDGNYSEDESPSEGENPSEDENPSEGESPSEDESPCADENPSEHDIDADEVESDGNSSADAPLDHTIRKALKQVNDIGSVIQKLKRKAQEDSDTIEDLKRKAECEAFTAKRQKTESDRDLQNMRKKCDDLENDKLQLTVELKQKADRDVIKEANEYLRHELDEKKAELRRELIEKADYRGIKNERTDFHSQLIKKTDDCNKMEKKNAELQRELVETTNNCAALTKEVEELQRKLDL